MELVGTSEIAALTSATRSAVSNWVARDPSFPKPVADLACGQIWEKQTIEAWILKNNLSNGGNMNQAENLVIGQVYTHDFICKTFGGDAKSGTYLPQSKQTILCGCFTTEMNPKDAPKCILLGDKPRVLAKAEKLAAQGGALPVFLKLGTNQWIYKGEFVLDKFSKSPSDFEAAAAEVGRVDIVAALFFKPTPA